MQTDTRSMWLGLAILLPALWFGSGRAVAAPQGGSAAPWLDLPGLAQGCDGSVRALAALPDGRIALGGTFTRCGTTDAARVAIWSPATGAYAALGSGVSAGDEPVVAGVSALLVDGGQLYVGGAFAQAGGVDARNLARFDPGSGTWSALGTPGAQGVEGEVLALAAGAGTLYVGGAFVRAGGQPATNLARFVIGTQSWSTLPSTPIGAVRALLFDAGVLYAGGDFQRIGTPTIAYLGRFDPATSTWSGLGTGVDGSVRALAAEGGVLYAGGAFRSAGGAPATLVAAWDGAAWSALGSGSGEGLRGGPLLLRTVNALAVAGGEVLASGDHLRAGARTASRIARFERRTRSWSALGGPAAEGLDAAGQALLVSARVAYVGGGFRSAGGAARGGLAALVAPDTLFRDGFEPAP